MSGPCLPYSEEAVCSVWDPIRRWKRQDKNVTYRKHDAQARTWNYHVAKDNDIVGNTRRSALKYFVMHFYCEILRQKPLHHLIISKPRRVDP